MSVPRKLERREASGGGIGSVTASASTVGIVERIDSVVGGSSSFVTMAVSMKIASVSERHAVPARARSRRGLPRASRACDDGTMTLADWLPSLAVGSTFTLLGGVKLYGVARGIVGGRDKPLAQYVCGT